jgi:hypothetical protein
VKRVLFLLPTAWDAPQLAACRPAWDGRYEPVLGQPTDDSCSWEDDPFALLEAALAEHGGRIDGVTSSSDYPGATLAGAMARRLGLPGSDPEAVIRTSHKYTSRVLQRGAVPQATPGFALVDPRAPDPAAGVRFPCYLKPVKGAFSIMSRRIDTPEQLRAFVTSPAAWTTAASPTTCGARGRTARTASSSSRWTSSRGWRRWCRRRARTS